MRRASPTRFTRRRPTACRWWRASCCAGSWVAARVRTDRSEHRRSTEFARRIVALYRDAALWQTLRDNALERVRAEHGRAQYQAAVRQVLEA